MMKSCWWRTTREEENKMMIEDESLNRSSSPIRAKWDRQTQYMPKTSNQQENQRKKKIEEGGEWHSKTRETMKRENCSKCLERQGMLLLAKIDDDVRCFKRNLKKRWWNWTREERNWLCNHHRVMMRMTWSVYFWTCRQSSLFLHSLNRVYWTVTEILLLQSTLLYQDNHRITSNKDK